MRGRVRAGSGRDERPRDVFASTADSEVWVVRGDSAVAQRTSAYARRVFRDAHPLDDLAGLVDDGNGYRILLGPLGVKGSSGQRSDAAAAGPGLRHDVVGGRRRGRLLVRQVRHQPGRAAGVHRRGRPVGERRPGGVRTGRGVQRRELQRREPLRLPRRPVRRLRLRRQHRLPGRRARRSTTCPASAADYDEHLGALAGADGRRPPRTGRPARPGGRGPGHLHGQRRRARLRHDRRRATASPTRCRSWRSASRRSAGRAYDAAYDRDGADDRGIVAAFLYRADRVELLPAAGPVLGASPTVAYRGAALAYNTDVQNPKALNAELPVGRGHLDRRGRLQRLHPRAAGGPVPRLAERHRRERRRPRGVGRPLRDLEPLLVDAQRARRAAAGAGRVRGGDRDGAPRRRTRACASTRAATSTCSPGRTTRSSRRARPARAALRDRAARTSGTSSSPRCRRPRTRTCSRARRRCSTTCS